MHTTRLRLEGKSIEELKARVLAEHGPAARIVAAERITVGGVAGFFAKRHFEATVEIGAPVPQGSRVVIDAPARVGIAALLEDAEEREAALHSGAASVAGGTGTAGAGTHTGGAGTARGGAPDRSAAFGGVAASTPGIDGSGPSTRTPAFAELLDDLTYNAPSPAGPGWGDPTYEQPTPADSATLLAVPAPLGRAGDLVFVIGLAQDALAVATSMAATVGSSAVGRAGAVTGGADRIETRRDALAARALGVERGESTFVACGWGADAVDILVAAQPDQVWVAVDAARKPADTALWVASVASAVRIDALATVGSATTSTPETVEDLGLPIGWIDDRPATSRAA